jgi:hypothetical protein
VDDLAKNLICILGSYGYSYRFIAMWAFDYRSIDDVEEKYIQRVGSVLSQNKIRVTDWRNGLTAASADFATQVMKPKQRKAKRAA